MIAGLSVWVAIGCVVLVYVGATVQGVLGIGMGMITAPLLALADPDFVPVAIVIAVVPLSSGVAWHGRQHVDGRDVGVALIGRVPGVVLGTMAVAAFTERALAALVAGSVLLAVLASATSVRFRTTPRTLLAAGFASGFAGTAVGIGGPPMAITYQRSDPETMRASVSAFFAIGALLSTLSLWIGGHVGSRELQLTALIMPAVLAGLVTSPFAARCLPATAVRSAVLTLCAASAVALIVDEVV